MIIDLTVPILKTLYGCIKLFTTVVWENSGRKNFCWRVGMTKIKHTKVFLPQINREVYNGL